VVVVEGLAKALLREAGLSVPGGEVAGDAQSAALAAGRLGGTVALKAQIAAGKRGKGGGVRFARDARQALGVARDMLGSVVGGHVVRTVLVESAVSFERELYAAVMNDPTTGAALVLFSTAGGVDVEEMPASRMRRASVDIRTGFSLDAARALVEQTDLVPAAREAVARALRALYDVYLRYDAELVEVNPLALGVDGAAHALDCKLVLDDSARARHAALFERAAEALGPEGTELERRARVLGLLYMELDGDVGILANGAGLTMTTMDVVTLYGGRPANFMEIGGDAYTKATPALEIVLANPNVRSLLVNFCGAFAQTDVMARGVADAVLALRPSVPMAFSIHGTGEEAAVAIVRDELGIEPYDSMDDAVRAAIAAAVAVRPNAGSGP
jgi:succinyl-CoA synthetase beta subunit